jgi:hypothetical protein
LVVGQITPFLLAAQANHASVQVDAFNRRFNEARVPQERADRQRTMAGVECSGTDLEQQRGQDDEIIVTDKNDLDIRPMATQPLQATGGRNPAEAATKDDDPSLSCLPVTGMVR